MGLDLMSEHWGRGEDSGGWKGFPRFVVILHWLSEASPTSHMDEVTGEDVYLMVAHSSLVSPDNENWPSKKR